MKYNKFSYKKWNNDTSEAQNREPYNNKITLLTVWVLCFFPSSLYPSETEAMKDNTTTHNNSSSSSSIVLPKKTLFFLHQHGSADQVDSPLLFVLLGLPYASYVKLRREKRMKIFNVRGCFGSKTYLRLNLVSSALRQADNKSRSWTSMQLINPQRLVNCLRMELSYQIGKIMHWKWVGK